VWTEFAARTVTSATKPPAQRKTQLQLVAPINGVASGQIVLSSTQPLTEVSAVAGELKSAGAMKAALSVRVRFATHRPLVKDELLVAGGTAAGSVVQVYYTLHDAFVAANQTVQSVYVTVAVPPDAAAGEYRGSVKVRTNLGETEVPLQVTVPDFVLPDPSDLNIWMALSHSPTQLAYFYQVPHYSDQHWEKIETQMQLVSQVGNHVLYIPVLWHVNNGSGPQMITFKEEGGKLTPDFTLLDRYLKLAARYYGPQRYVVLGVWGKWQRETGSTRTKADELFVTTPEANGGYGMLKLSADYSANAALWTAVFDGVATRVKTHLNVPASRIVLGNGDDRHPTNETDAAWQKIAPESPGWHAWTHHYGDMGPRPVLFEIVDPTCGRDVPKAGESWVRGGWDATTGKTLFLSTVRDIQFDGVPPAYYFSIPDISVGKQRTGTTVGLARIGLDYWPKRVPGVSGVDSGFNGGSRAAPGRVDRNRTTTLTAPGPKGPVAMLHYEALREGVQAAEARIVVEKAVQAKVGDTAAFEQALQIFWTKGSRCPELYTLSDRAAFEDFGGWQEGTLPLYVAAAEAQRLLQLRDAAVKSAKAGEQRRQSR